VDNETENENHLQTDSMYQSLYLPGKQDIKYL